MFIPPGLVTFEIIYLLWIYTMGMPDQVIDETCPDCGSQLVETPESDPMNTHDGDAVTCPECGTLIRVE